MLKKYDFEWRYLFTKYKEQEKWKSLEACHFYKEKILSPEEEKKQMEKIEFQNWI